jgi:NAD(P)-dependent dehydrogenase (short-subunit alcohol dehydrogenase family)
MAHVGGTNRTVYCMTKAMAIALAQYGIRVHAIGPKLCVSDMSF